MPETIGAFRSGRSLGGACHLRRGASRPGAAFRVFHDERRAGGVICRFLVGRTGRALWRTSRTKTHCSIGWRGAWGRSARTRNWPGPAAPRACPPAWPGPRTELRSLATGIEALRQRFEQQDAVTVRLEAAAAKSEADLQGLRQTVETLSRRVREQAEGLARSAGRKPRPRAAALIGIALAVLVLGGGAAAWIASGREPTVGALAHRFVVRLSELSGIDLAGPGEPTQSVRTVAQATPDPPPRPWQASPQPQAPAACVGTAPLPHPAPCGSAAGREQPSSPRLRRPPLHRASTPAGRDAGRRRAATGADGRRRPAATGDARRTAATAETETRRSAGHRRAATGARGAGRRGRPPPSRCQR